MNKDFENKNNNTRHNSIIRSAANGHEQIFKTDYIIGVAKYLKNPRIFLEDYARGERPTWEYKMYVAGISPIDISEEFYEELKERFLKL